MTKKKSKRKATAKRAESKANYGPNENRRFCHKCMSTKSTTAQTRRTGNLIIRYRVCDDCGQRRTSQELCTTS